MESTDEDVSPRKKARVVKKRRTDDEEEEPTSSHRSRKPAAKTKSPERKKKGRKSMQAGIHVDAQYTEEEEEPSDNAEDNAEDEDPNATARDLSNEDEIENARFRMDNGDEEDCFAIPTRDDDLLYHGKTGYKIAHVMTFEEAEESLHEYEDEIGQGRWCCLYERFPAFFALLRKPSSGTRMETSPALRSRLTYCLIQTYTHMTPHLKRVLGKAGSPNVGRKVRAHCRDLSDHILMMCYLLHKLVCIFEDEAMAAKTKKKAAKKAAGRGRAKKGKGVVQNEDGDILSGADDDATMGGDGGNAAEEENSWEENRVKVLDCLTEMVNATAVDNDGKTIDSALKYLWKGILDRNLRNTLLDLATKFLMNPDITRPPARPVLTGVCKLIRAMCINFRQFQYTGSLLFITLTSLDYYKEGSATAYPFFERMRAVGGKDMDKLFDTVLDWFQRNSITVSSNNAKALCLFMATIGEQEPFITFTHITAFLNLLTDENASVRSTILNVIASLLQQDFLDPTKTPLSERFTIARNRMFDHLLQHVRDVNANVRASALKCLTSMARANKIPPELIQEGLMKLVSHRISDDKVAVRKEAIRFATIFLANNPYGHDFDKHTNVASLKESLNKRDNIRVDGADMKAIKEAESVWNRSKHALEAAVLTQVEMVLMETYDLPALEERKDMYRGFQQRELSKEFGDAASQEQMDEPRDRDCMMRWLFTLLLSEDNGNGGPIQEVTSAARLLVGMAITDQLKNEFCSKEDLDKSTSSEYSTKLIMKAGRFVYVATASMIMCQNEQMILEKEQEMERMKKMRKSLSKDIQHFMMKLVFEKEYALCLKAGMDAVLQGDGSDLKLGIEFVIKCKEFNITGAEMAVRKLCGLVWKSDEEGRQQILQAASSMFLSCNPVPRLRDAATCENILNLVKSMSDHERGSVEQVLALTTKFNPMPRGVYNLLWEIVDEESIREKRKVTQEKRIRQVAAMKALCLLSRSAVEDNRKWLRRYQGIVQDGWPEIAAEALGCIANLATWNTKEDGTPVDVKPYRIPGTDSLFKIVQRFMLTELCREEALTWNRSLRATLDIYFHICKDTQEVVGDLTAKLMWFLKRTSQALRYYDQLQTQNGNATPRSQRHGPTLDPIAKEIAVEERSKYLNRLWSVLLERLCVLTGEVAVRLLVHADYVFVREFIKARQYIAAQTEGEPFPRRKLLAWEENSVVRRGIFDWGTNNAEDVEATGLTEDERIREMARKMIDEQLVDHYQSLLGRLLPVVVHSVRATGSPRRVRFQAMSALAKIMLVSPNVAQYGARTFFAFLNNAESPVLRSNLAVIAADLTFRHPNLVENHAAALFNQLQDPEPQVRETCVLILNHLISNDLIKTHVIMSYALLGYVDTTSTIVHLTRGLFHEWSKKEGIMNHVPSFITRIAADSRKVSLEKFRRIMDEFFPLIRERKDADVQALVVKLCKRIELAKNPACVVRNPEMPAYFSYCLKLLTLNNRGFHKLSDCFEQFAPYLGDTRVYEDISNLVKEFKKTEAKNPNSDLSDEINVFLMKLDEVHKEKARLTDAEANLEKDKKASRGGGAVSQSGTARRVRAHRALASAVSTPARAPKGGKRGGKRRVIETSSEEEEDNDEE